MLFDKQLMFADKQTAMATGAVGTDHIKLNGAAHPGAGRGMGILAQLVALGAGCTNLKVDVEGGNAVDGGGAPTWADAVVIGSTELVAAPVAGTILRGRLFNPAKVKFMRAKVTFAGTGPITLTVGLVLDLQTAAGDGAGL